MALTLTRRDLVKAGAAGAVAVSLPAGRAPAALLSRPRFTHGIQSGDVTADSAIVWARADRPSRMIVQLNHGGGRVEGPLLTAETDFTGKVALAGLPAGQEIAYRVFLEDADGHGRRSQRLRGSFRTAPDEPEDVSFVWSADIAGQGWGINPDLGGYRIFSAMAALEPDFFLCSGDTVYADNPLVETVPLPGGRTWRNLVTAAKSKVAETLDEFRGQFAYNLLDANLRDFAARVP